MPKSCAHMHTTSLQNGQLKLWRWSRYLAWETHKDTAISVWACQVGFWKSTRTSCQQQNYQDWQYGLVSMPFSSPLRIMYRSAFCIAMSRLKCLVWSIFVFHLAAWSNLTDPWQNFSDAEFHIFSVYHDINYYYILLPRLWVMWLNHQRVTMASFKLQHNKPNTNLLSVNASRILFTRCVGASVILKALLFCCCYCWKSASHIHLSFILFQVFCSLLRCFLHRRKCCWLQIPFWYAVFRKVCEIILSEVLTTQMDVMRRSIKVSSFHLKCTNLVHFCLRGSIPQELVHSYILGCLWIVIVCCNTVGRHG